MSSNKACCWILGILAGGFVLMALIIGWGISNAISGGFQAKFEPQFEIEPNTWLYLNPSGSIADYSSEPNLGILGGGPGGSTLNEMTRALKLAGDDPNIAGVVVRPQGVTGMASLRELRNAILEFRQSDKPVYAHLDVATDRDYYLASVCDSIFLMPGRLSGINFGGIGLSNTYVKSTFEKLGIKFHVFHAGRYKGAYEDFARDSMSAEVRESLTYLFNDIYKTYVEETASSRSSISFESLNREIMEGEEFIVSAQSCLNRGYVDGLNDWPVLKKRLQGGSEEFESITAHRYLNTTHASKLQVHSDEVAVLYAQGPIEFGDDSDVMQSDEITASGLIKQLDNLAENDEVKAVVLRVNSPGGSALASKQILESARRLKAKKPLIVSMGRIAASGGYYISMAADKIVVQPNTITGSIGVVSMFPTAEELYRKIGAREETISIGRWANFFRIDKDLGSEQKAVLGSLMDSVYAEFREDVSTGRKLEMSIVDTVAEGRVWTGNQAVARGLADTLGGLDLAVKLAATQANLVDDEYDVRYYPRERDVFNYIVDRFLSSVNLMLNAANQLDTLYSTEAVKEKLKGFYNRFEFLQTVLPVSFDL